MCFHVFEILKDNCEERELSFQALCEQVSLRISSINDIPIPAAAKQRCSTGNPEATNVEEVVADITAETPAVIPYAEVDHLIFDPTTLTR